MGIEFVNTFLAQLILAYLIVEFIISERLNIKFRALIMLLIIFIEFVFFEASRYKSIPAGIRVIGNKFILAGVLAIGVYLLIFYLFRKLKNTDGKEFWILISKQSLMILVFYLISTQMSLDHMRVMNHYGFQGIRSPYQWIWILIIFIANIWFAPHLIRAILDDLGHQTKVHKKIVTDDSGVSVYGAYHAGKLIGILERLLIIIAVFFSADSLTINISMVGFVLGTKTIARFKKFDREEFVEYFIIGTLTSVLFALISIGAICLVVA